MCCYVLNLFVEQHLSPALFRKCGCKGTNKRAQYKIKRLLFLLSSEKVARPQVKVRKKVFYFLIQDLSCILFDGLGIFFLYFFFSLHLIPYLCGIVCLPTYGRRAVSYIRKTFSDVCCCVS